MGMEPAACPQRTSPKEEITSLINSGLIDAKDAAYLRVLQSLVKPTEPLPYGVDNEEGSLESGLTDDAGRRRGMRAFTDLEQIAHEVRYRGGALAREFEREECELVGARPGMPWTLKDGRKARHWGKHQGLERSAAMTLEVYLILANLKDPSQELKQSKAQLIQNYPALHQASLDGGSWE